MSRYQTCEDVLARCLPTDAQRAFLRRVDEVVRALMPQGQANLEQVASQLCLHPAKLRRDLKTATGLTPNNYILTLRFRRALQLFREHPRRNLAQIALECGFADHAHLTHAFRRFFDLTPMQYMQGL